MTETRVNLLTLSDETRFLTNICPYCGNRYSKIAFVGRDQLLENARECSVMVCQDCGGLFTDGSSFSSLADYYQSVYPPVYHEMFSGGRDEDAGSNPGVSKVLEHLYSIRERPFTVLDVGCGNGGFLNYLRNKGFGVAGVEINKNAVVYCKSHYGIEVFNGPLELFDPPGLFDAITMLGTIEHFTNPIKTLSVAARLLKPEGILIFDYPDLDCLEYKIVKSRWWGLDLPRHVLQLRQRDIDRILNASDLSYSKRYGVVRTWFHYSYLTPPLRHGIPNSSVLGFLVKLVAGLFLLVRAKPLTVCICRKQ
jgi:SAM-dependent methyltransferase